MSTKITIMSSAKATFIFNPTNTNQLLEWVVKKEYRTYTVRKSDIPAFKRAAKSFGCRIVASYTFNDSDWFYTLANDLHRMTVGGMPPFKPCPPWFTK